MKKLHLNIVITFALLLNITMVYSQNNKKNSVLYIHNKKGQLLADTSLIADSSIANIYNNYSRIKELELYSEILYLVIYREFFIESGIQGKLIFKFELQPIDSIDGYYSIIKDITIVGHNQIDISAQRMLLNMNKEFLIDRKIPTGYHIGNYSIYVPIDYRIVSHEDKKNTRFVHKFFEDGYLVIEASAHYIVNYDN